MMKILMGIVIVVMLVGLGITLWLGSQQHREKYGASFMKNWGRLTVYYVLFFFILVGIFLFYVRS
ncbi:hypothetical protein [Paenibacillus sp. 481]|uniref:hypothetical protein n=1 Tax=Paenibacillus sp. 481 TaxID=2835869 RepID=UPI001E56E90D|nr:hypothetical protein [Paenibacillus sp. 481]UHA73575.1 hypothetical protein KIK04_24040 [Paenibacillus sp. 481]